MTITRPRATLKDLYQIPENGKAELVNGEIVRMSPTGARPGRAGGEIHFSLRLYEEQTGGGYAFPDNVGFTVNLPHRASFSPDVAWYIGDVEDADMDFLPGAPVFAVEIRSKNDYGIKAEEAIAAKIKDYFAAGTQVVWDVDVQSVDVIRKYTTSDPDYPTVFRRGEIADAEPAVPGWRFPVNNLFEKRR
jgi:Uma2 family endonuclease